MDESRFQPDLYRGTARYYDSYRLPYPRILLDELLGHIPAGDRKLAVDHACGTGQIALALAHAFETVVAIDSEPEMAAFTATNAVLRGLRNVETRTGRAEDYLFVPDDVDLFTIGNAFHRLERWRMAEAAFKFLRPGGWVALLWSDTPWRGDAPWQSALRDVIQRWIARRGASDRVPAGLDAEITATPHAKVFADAGFEPASGFEVIEPHTWTTASLHGFMLSTSVLSPSVLGHEAAAFEADVRETLLAAEPSGMFRQEVSFAYELARKPADAPLYGTVSRI